jgi:hypothetical protein
VERGWEVEGADHEEMREGTGRRPIVEFAVENRLMLKRSEGTAGEGGDRREG